MAHRVGRLTPLEMPPVWAACAGSIFGYNVRLDSWRHRCCANCYQAFSRLTVHIFRATRARATMYCKISCGTTLDHSRCAVAQLNPSMCTYHILVLFLYDIFRLCALWSWLFDLSAIAQRSKSHDHNAHNLNISFVPAKFRE